MSTKVSAEELSKLFTSESEIGASKRKLMGGWLFRPFKVDPGSPVECFTACFLMRDGELVGYLAKGDRKFLIEKVSLVSGRFSFGCEVIESGFSYQELYQGYMQKDSLRVSRRSTEGTYTFEGIRF